MNRQLTFCIIGGAQNTGNLGVSALGAATIRNLKTVFPNCCIILQQQSSRPKNLTISFREEVENIDTLFLHSSFKIRERYGTKYALTIARITKNFPKHLCDFIRSKVTTLQTISKADVVFDISGGDSFSSIYGENVFRSMVSFKQIPLLLRKPLVLLPQTFGPFDGELVCEQVASIFRESALITSRDLDGLQEIKGIMKCNLDNRFSLCPDVAFTLDPISVPLERETFFNENQNSDPVIGLNVSGLLYANRRDFGINIDYKKLIYLIVELAVKEIGGKVLLVPHVVGTAKMPTTGTAMENTDFYACKKVLKELKNEYGKKLGMITGNYNAGEIKYLIRKCDFFIGSRMHACIAAASQKIPTIALSYSKKFAGVFGLAGIPDIVIDLREGSAQKCVRNISNHFLNRFKFQPRLSTQIDLTKHRVQKYFQEELPSRLTLKPNLTELISKRTR
jgi:polysaccharide pyruvyl transferase WcaK-like protein